MRPTNPQEHMRLCSRSGWPSAFLRKGWIGSSSGCFPDKKAWVDSRRVNPFSQPFPLVKKSRLPSLFVRYLDENENVDY